MNTSVPRRAPLLLLAILIGACTGKGPDVVDPDSNARRQTSILAVAVDGSSDLAIAKEPDGVSNARAYSDANGVMLDRRVDGIYESFDRLYLLHRATSSISVVDLATRKKLAEITGFSDSASALCGVAFSNLSQGWAVDYNRPFVFHFDAVNAVLVDSLPITGRPTSVATIDEKVFVGSELPDGRGLVSIFASNFTTFRIDQTLNLPSPPIFMTATADRDGVVIVTSGPAGGKPTIHYILRRTMAQSAERALNVADLTARIGTAPEYATLSRDNFLYLATALDVLQIDVNSSRLSIAPKLWLEGDYSTIGVDYWTELLYAYDPLSSALKRMDRDGNELEPLSVPAPVSAIEFVNSSQVQ